MLRPGELQRYSGRRFSSPRSALVGSAGNAASQTLASRRQTKPSGRFKIQATVSPGARVRVALTRGQSARRVMAGSICVARRAGNHGAAGAAAARMAEIPPEGVGGEGLKPERKRAGRGARGEDSR